MSSIAYLHNWHGPGPAALTGGDTPACACLPLYALEAQAPSRWRALLVPAHTDQRYLASQRAWLDTYLEGGGTLVVNGHVAHPFLRWLRPFVPAPAHGLDGLRVHPGRAHPVFAGVDPEDLTFRRGVAGFYARGGNPPPDGAWVLNTLGPERIPVDWLLTLPGGGRLLVHSGNDLWMFANSPDTAARVLPQLLDWITSDPS